MRVLVVDDEPLARERLRRLLEAFDDCQVVGEAATGEEALTEAERLGPEVVLMDIRMPGMDGLEAAARLSRLERPPAVIFTTAHDEHALEAFHAQAVDYLLKPVRRERLRQALDHAARPNRSQIQSLSAASARPEQRSHLAIRTRAGMRRVPVAEVAYFQADQKYVTVAWGSARYLTEESLKHLEEEFGDRFVRVHRNALVALEFVEGLERDALGRTLVRLRGQEETLAVSRRHLAGVRQRLRQ